VKRIVISLCVLAILLVAAGSVAGYAVFRQAENRTPGNFFDSAGVKIYFTDEGQGEPVILVHGFAANADLNWRKPGITSALAKTHRVIVLDNRGHGLSDKPHAPEAYGIEMANDLIRLMDHLKIEKAHVVGYSMGAFITLKLLTTHPDRLLSASCGGAGWQQPDPQNLAQLDKLAAALESGRGFVAPLWKIIANEDGQLGAFARWGIERAMSRNNDLRALACVARGFQSLVVPEEALRNNTVPTLGIAGTNDPLAIGVQNMKGIMANFEAVDVQGGDHLTTLPRPEYKTSLGEFLKRHAQGEKGPLPAPKNESAATHAPTPELLPDAA